MTSLKAKIQETLRSMSTTAHSEGALHSVGGNISKLTGGIDSFNFGVSLDLGGAKNGEANIL